MATEIWRLGATDAARYREIRLTGLRDHPEAFGASWEDEASQPLDWFAERLQRNAVFGGSLGKTGLAGVVGLLVPHSSKSSHKGILWGMFVRPEGRRTGLGTALVARVIEYATCIVEDVQLTVEATNMAAIHLYDKAGFSQYGLERNALKVDGQYYDHVLMTKPLSRNGQVRPAP